LKETVGKEKYFHHGCSLGSCFVYSNLCQPLSVCLFTQVHCHPGCNELIARYKIEDTSVTLTITLPLDHPLGPVSVQVSDKKLHARISQLLNTRSHSLSAGLELWKENLDGMYKDVEECAICFFVVNSTTKQLPKMGCKTCRKKFHSACLVSFEIKLV